MIFFEVLCVVVVVVAIALAAAFDVAIDVAVGFFFIIVKQLLNCTVEPTKWSHFVKVTNVLALICLLVLYFYY